MITNFMYFFRVKQELCFEIVFQNYQLAELPAHLRLRLLQRCLSPYGVWLYNAFQVQLSDHL